MTQKSATVDSTIKAGLSRVPPQKTPDDVEEPDQFGWFEIGRIALVALSAAITWSGRVPKFQGLDLLAVPVTLTGGYSVFAKAFFNLVDRRMTMELSMTIALAAALAIGEMGFSWSASNGLRIACSRCSDTFRYLTARD
jgi:cation transport ATPase